MIMYTDAWDYVRITYWVMRRTGYPNPKPQNGKCSKQCLELLGIDTINYFVDVMFQEELIRMVGYAFDLATKNIDKMLMEKLN